MPRKIFGYDGLADFFAHQQNRPIKAGMVELQMGKNFTPEEEDRAVTVEVRNACRVES